MERSTHANLATLVTEPISAERVVLDRAALGQLPEADRRAVLHAALGSWRWITGRWDLPRWTRWRAAWVSTHAPAVPHPLAGGAAWTRVGAHDGQPIRLCLHTADALPTAPLHPYLDAGWREAQGAHPLQVPGGHGRIGRMAADCTPISARTAALDTGSKTRIRGPLTWMSTGWVS